MNAVAGLIFFFFLSSAQAERGVILAGPLQFEGVAAPARLPADRLASAEAVWVWSPFQEPRRLAPEALHLRSRPLLGSGAGLRVLVPAARDARNGALRLIAAPIEMWREVPETFLPSWPVPRSGRLSIPVDSKRPWRLRVAGETAGSFWMDLAAGTSGAVVPVSAAPGSRFVVVGEGNRPLAGTSVRIFTNEPWGVRGAKSWAFLVGDTEGRFALPGLPDLAELRWLAAGSGRPPRIVVSPPSRLERIVLADGAEVRGRLVDPGGRPLAGLDVQVEAWISPEAPIPVTLGDSTDRRGHFTAKAVPPGRAILTATGPSWAPLRLPIDVPPEGLDLGNLVLSQGQSLAVRVTDERDEPIAGAEIRPDLGAPASTAFDGTATLSPLPAGATTRLVATAEGHLRGEKTVDLPSPPVHLRLQRAFTVRGRFLDANRRPLRGAALQVKRGRSFDTAPLEPDGRFSLALRPLASYELVFSSSGSAPLEVSVPAGAAGEEKDLGELLAPASHGITGRLVSAASGEPVAGGRIWSVRSSARGPLMAWMEGDLLETVSGPAGRFRLEGFAPGGARLRIEAPGFAPYRYPVQIPPEGDVEIGDVALVAGTALQVSAGPEAEGALAAVDSGGEGLPFDRLSAPVVGGTARVERVPAGPARLRVERGGSILCENELLVPAGAENLAVECPAAGIVVHGAVTLGGRPAPSGALLWEPPSGSLPEGFVTTRSPSGLTRQEVFTTRAPAVTVPTGERGAFVSQELRPGSWEVSFLPDSGGSTAPLRLTLNADPEQSVVLPFPASSIAGRVQEEDGRVVEGARVREVESGATVVTGEDGSFRFHGLEPKSYYFKAFKEERASEPARAEVSEKGEPPPLVLVLQSERKRTLLEIRALGANGAPQAGAFVFVEIPGQGLRVLTADSEGTARMEVEPPYPTSLRAACYAAGAWALGGWEPYERARREMTVAAGPVGSLAVEGSTASGAVQILGPGDWDLTKLLGLLGSPPLLDSELGLKVEGLPIGPYALRLGAGSAQVTVREGEVSRAFLGSG